MEALSWRASDLVNLTREGLGHNLEVCFTARFPQESTGQGVPTTQEFITKTIQELQDARAMRGDNHSQSVAHHPGEGAELRACVDIPGLNRAASQERFWPSLVGRCEGPPHSFVRMPLGLPNMASAHQRHVQQVQVA